MHGWKEHTGWDEGSVDLLVLVGGVEEIGLIDCSGLAEEKPSIEKRELSPARQQFPSCPVRRMAAITEQPPLEQWDG